MRIMVATDAAPPQVNGVVQTYRRLAQELGNDGIELKFLCPNEFRTIALPAYPEIRLALPNFKHVRARIREYAPDFIHVATEGPIGWMTRSICLARGLRFTTSYHTKFPEYLSAFLGIPVEWCYHPARRFHNAGRGTMVATRSLACDLSRRGFKRLKPWTRGVDTDLFKPRDVRLFGRDKPVFLYVGRISPEKNIEAFLESKLTGLKVVVGDGPHLSTLRRNFPSVIFTGVISGEQLAQHYASADVFVFPSRTDTFGLVLLEAMASGLPVAAYPVTGPADVVVDGVTGCLDLDLGRAARNALDLGRKAARAHACTYSWQNSARQFMDNIRSAAEIIPASNPNER